MTLVEYTHLITEVLIVGAGCYVKYLFGKFRTEQKNKEEAEQERRDKLQAQLDLYNEALQAILRDRILQGCRNFIEQGISTRTCRANIIAMHDVYKSLGGNGVVDEYFNQFINLPISTKKDTI